MPRCAVITIELPLGDESTQEDAKRLADVIAKHALISDAELIALLAEGYPFGHGSKPCGWISDVHLEEMEL